MYNKIIIRDNVPYEIKSKVPKSRFINRDGSLNKHVLGLYVKEFNCDKVLEIQGKFLICKTIEDAEIEM